MVALAVTLTIVSPARANDPGAYGATSYTQSEPHPRSLDEYLEGQAGFSYLGVTLRDDASGLDSGATVRGLLITSVAPGSPAARAGLTAANDNTKKVIAGVAVAASMLFPPAMFALPVVALIGQNGDLVIAVDSSRVLTILDFQDQLSDLQPGETLYLTIIRAGKRVQVPVQLPSAMPN